MKLIVVSAIAIVFLTGAALAQTSGTGSSPGAASGGALGSSAGAPGTNSLGTAAPSGGRAGLGGASGLGAGDPKVDREEKRVDRKIKSICRGC